MRNKSWYSRLIFILLFFSVLIYFLQILVFNDFQNTVLNFLQDLAFLPIEVLLVTVLIDHLMRRRERKRLIEKMNMVIGVFFSEIGVELLKYLLEMDLNNKDKITALFVRLNSEKIKHKDLKKLLGYFTHKMDVNCLSLKQLKDFLFAKSESVNRILGNPNLIEHESFTGLLWAVSHLVEELKIRKNLENLTKDDLEHLENDIIRIYSQIIFEWVFYMNHLKGEYPYIYKLYQQNISSN